MCVRQHGLHLNDWMPSESEIRPQKHLSSTVSLFVCEQEPCYIWHVATETGLHLRTIVASSTKGGTNCAEVFFSFLKYPFDTALRYSRVQRHAKELRRKRKICGKQVIIFH